MNVSHGNMTLKSNVKVKNTYIRIYGMECKSLYIFDRVCLRCVDDKEAFGFLRYSLLMLAVHIWEWPFDVSGSYLEMEF